MAEEEEKKDDDGASPFGRFGRGKFKKGAFGLKAAAALTEKMVDSSVSMTKKGLDSSVSYTKKGIEGSVSLTTKAAKATIDATTDFVDDVVETTQDLVEDSVTLTKTAVTASVDATKTAIDASVDVTKSAIDATSEIASASKDMAIKAVDETMDIVDAYQEEGLDGVKRELNEDAAQIGARFTPSKGDAPEGGSLLERHAAEQAKAARRERAESMGVSLPDPEEPAEDAPTPPPPFTEEEKVRERYLRLKFEGSKVSVPHAGAGMVGAESSMEELLQYKEFLLMLEGMAPTTDVPPLPKYKVVQPAILRSGFEMNSHKNPEALMMGEVIEVVESVPNSDGITRLRCSRGWSSERASDGTALLEPVLSEEEERKKVEAREAAWAAARQEELKREEADREFAAASDALVRGQAMEAVAALRRAVKVDESRAEEAMERMMDAGHRCVRAGSLKDAVAVFTACVETEPENEATKEALAQAEEQLRRQKLARARDDYLLEILNEQSSCLDPVTGRRVLLSEMSCSLRVLAGMERAKLREKVDSREAGLLEDNSVYELRGGGAPRGDDALHDTAAILLDEEATGGKLHNAVVIGPPRSGRSSLLRQLCYMAAVAGQDSRESPVPVLINLESLVAQCDEGELDAMALVKARDLPEEQHAMLREAFDRQEILFLCDNLDRCGQHYKTIASYLVNTLSTTARIVVTAGLARFKHQHLFARFGVVQLDVLSPDVQRKTGRARLSSGKHEGFEKILAKPAVGLFATTPLTLCMVIELYSSGKMEEKRSSSRAGLYEQCAHLMIDRLSRGSTSPRDGGLSGGSESKFWLLLEALAYSLHTRGARDFEEEDVRELGEDEYELWRGVAPLLRSCAAPILCQLPPTEVAVPESPEVENGSIRGTWRFTHVALQEFFFAAALMKRLEAEVDLSSRQVARETTNNILADKLYNEWFREPLLIVASCAEDQLLGSIVDCVLSGADTSGANEMLALRLLDERPEFAQTAYRDAAMERRRKRVLSTMMHALAHPCAAVRESCIEELQVVGLAPESVAQHLVEAIRKSRRAQNWIQLVYLLRSVTAMRMEEADTALAETVADLVTPTSDLRVVCEAAKCLRRLRISTDKITVALVDVVDRHKQVASSPQSGHPSALSELAQTLGRLGNEWDQISLLVDKRLESSQKEAKKGGKSQREITQLYKAGIEALGAAGEHHAEDVVPTLDNWLQHSTTEVVCAAARALGSVGEEERVTGWVMGRITSRYALPQKLAAVTALRSLAQGQIDGDGGKISGPVIDTFVEALKEVSIEVKRAATNELKLVSPPVVDRDVSEALRDIVTDDRLDIALRLDATENLTAVCVEAARVGGAGEVSIERLLERRRKHKQLAEADLEAERRQRDMERHCRASIEAAEALEEPLREMMEVGNTSANTGICRVSDWDVRRRAAHALVKMSVATKKGTNSRLLTAVLAWSHDEESRAEAFTLLGQLGSRRQRVREVLVAACREGGAGALEAADALAQIYSGRGYSGELAAQKEVEESLIEMLLRPPDEFGQREEETVAVRSLVALYAPTVARQHAHPDEDDTHIVEVVFTKPASLGISFSSRAVDVPPFISAIKPETEAASFAELVYGLVLKKVQEHEVHNHSEAIDYIKKGGRPLTLTFTRPPPKFDNSASGTHVGDHNDDMMSPPGVDATQEELDAYKEWLLLVHEEKKPTGAENGAGAAEASEPPLPLLPQHARLLLQRLAAFFHDEAMTSLWVLAAKTVMEFTRPPDGVDGASAAAALVETAEMMREATIDVLEHTLCHAPSAVVGNIAAKALQVLQAQSDALSSHLVAQLGNWPIEARTVVAALTLHDPNVLLQLLQHAAVRNRALLRAVPEHLSLIRCCCGEFRRQWAATQRVTGARSARGRLRWPFFRP